MGRRDDIEYQVLGAIFAAMRRRRLPKDAMLNSDSQAPTNSRVRALLKTFRTIRRIQINRDIVERSDLGGEG
jgi:hypothetical protein